jgi:importin subunit beta-1
MEVLKSSQAKPAARQLAGIVFKNTILNTTKDEGLYNLWEDMNEEQRDNLKTSSLEALMSEEKDVVRAAASAVTSICIKEIPYGRWLNVIEVLCSNTAHDDFKIKYASLVTLGYICEELRTEELQKEQSDYIISAFFESLEQNKNETDLILKTIEGVYHSMKFTVDHFKQNQGKLIMENIVSATTYPLVNVREVAMQCIVEAVRLCYDYIEPFMDEITQTTTNATVKDEQQVKTQAIEVWSSIAEEEKTRKDDGRSGHDLIGRALNILLDLITGCIQELNIGNEEVDEDQEWGTSVAAGCCLDLVTKCVGDGVVEPITAFVAEKIKDGQSWESKYCGIVALGAILEGPSKSHLHEVLQPAIPLLLDLIDDNHPRVRYVT